MNFEAVRKISDAVLYEGYLLYPYRASSVKNQFRWQFGVVAPRGYSENGGAEPWEMQAELLIEGRPEAVDVRVRYLEDGAERQVEVTDVSFLREQVTPFGSEALKAVLRISAEAVEPYTKLRVRIENLTPWDGAADREAALRQSLAGTQILVGVRGGAFVSTMDPPDEAKDAAARCSNLNTWPVLAGEPGERSLMLSLPIILYDYPQVAPESPGDLCDATEIDEILTLRVMTLTEEEKREAGAADERARAIIERSDAIPQEIFERLHGAIRQYRPEPFRKGDRVRIEPKRRADSMDMFLAGRVARVEAVERDFDDRTHVAVVVEDDPAADLHEWYGRFFYFDPDELEMVGPKEE